LGALLSGVILLIYKLAKAEEKLAWKNVLASITLGIPNFLSFYLLILALTSFGNSGAFVYPVFNIGVICISALVAYIFFKEKMNLLNKSGLALAVIALVLISYQELNVF